MLRLERRADQDFIRSLDELPDVRRFIGKIGPTDDYKHFGIICLGNVLAGIVGVAPSQALEGGNLELVCVVHPDHEGRGIASRACKAALDDYGRPDPPARMLSSEPRTSRRCRRGSPRVAQRLPSSAVKAPASATRSIRWWRPPAPDTAWPPDTWPDAPSRTRTAGWDRAGLPCEPGPWLLPRSPAPASPAGAPYVAGAAPRAPPSSGRPLCVPRPGPPASPSCGSSPQPEWVDLNRSLTLARQVYSYPGLKDREVWADGASTNIPWQFYFLYLQLADATSRLGGSEELVDELLDEAERFAVTALGGSRGAR